MVKLAVLLQLAAGNTRTNGDEHGTTTRGCVHTLLVGDSGTGKSQIMKYAARLSSRYVGDGLVLVKMVGSWKWDVVWVSVYWS